MPLTASEAGSSRPPSNGRTCWRCVAPRTSRPSGVELDQHRRDLEQRIRRGVEAAGLDVDDHRQEAAEAVAHRGVAAFMPPGRGADICQASVSPANSGTISPSPNGRLAGTVQGVRSSVTVPRFRGRP